MLPSENTLRSAAPVIDDLVAEAEKSAVVLAGGTLVELHPPRMGRADVLVRGESIVLVGSEEIEQLAQGVPRVDCTGCIVTPAFTNAHTHLYMALTPGMPPPPTPPRTLTETLQWVWWAVDRVLDDELVHTSALVGAAQAAKCGVACVIDHHSSPRAIDGSLAHIERALDEVGIRGVLSYEVSDRDGRGRRDGALRENRRFLERVKRGDSKHRGLVGAHAMMTLNDDTLDSLRDLADVHQVGMHLHVAEDLSDYLDAERNKKTTLAKRLERLGVARPGSVVAHAVQLDGSTADTITQAGGTIVVNPRSNMNHAVGVAGMGGGRVGIGTDGIDQDLFAEARAYHFRHTEARDNLARETSARLVASQELAAQLFGDAHPPRLVPGARADLTVIEYDPFTPMTPANLVDHLARGWTAGAVRDTMVGGQFVVREKKLVNLDERELTQRARAAASRLWERMQGYY